MKSTRITLERLFITLFAAACLLAALLFINEETAVTSKKGAPADLTAIAGKATLSPEDYRLLLTETGLGRDAVATLWRGDDREALLQREQERFYATPDYDCRILALFTKSEKVVDPADAVTFYDLRPGDVLLTWSTHTLFYRHGHAALVLDEETLLEAASIGKPAQTAKTKNWGFYPTVLQLRIGDDAATALGMSREELATAAARYGEEEILGDTYSLLAGAFGRGIASDETQCAYLIASAYENAGATVSSRSFPITPMSLLKSGAFEIVQCRGIDESLLSYGFADPF